MTPCMPASRSTGISLPQWHPKHLHTVAPACRNVLQVGIGRGLQRSSESNAPVWLWTGVKFAWARALTLQHASKQECGGSEPAKASRAGSSCRPFLGCRREVACSWDSHSQSAHTGAPSLGVLLWISASLLPRAAIHGSIHIVLFLAEGCPQMVAFNLTTRLRLWFALSV